MTRSLLFGNAVSIPFGTLLKGKSDLRAMTAHDSPIVAARRQRLQEWIEANYEGKQTLFISATGINQGELSGLLRSKSFGEKKAEALEQQAKMPIGYLVYPFGLNRLAEEAPAYHTELTESQSVELDEATVVHALRAMQRICKRRGWEPTIEAVIEHAALFVDALTMYADTEAETDQGEATVLEIRGKKGNGDGEAVRREAGGKDGGEDGGEREAASTQGAAAPGRRGRK